MSFRITQPDLSEAEKVQRRQAVVAEWLLSAVAQGAQVLRPEHTDQTLDLSELLATPFDVERAGTKNSENLIGSVAVPVGIAGPVQLQGTAFPDQEAVVLPIASSEGALVASISRGCKAINAAGGASSFVKKTGMTRAPVFHCPNGAAALQFAHWVETHQTEIANACEATSSHLTFLHLHSWVRGRLVFVRLAFDTDQAMGMNMVTIAIQTAWQTLQSQFAELSTIELVSLSSNACADKKDSVINRLLGRGYWTQAEVVLPTSVVAEVLKANAQQVIKTHVAKNYVGSNLAGSFSQNMQVGNVVAALFLATGQDLAHVTEGSQANTSVELTDQGLYVSVTLPNVNVGVVGGGTWLPAQTQARHLIRAGQTLTSEQLASVIGVAALAAEISGLAALSTHQLASAHQQLGR